MVTFRRWLETPTKRSTWIAKYRVSTLLTVRMPFKNGAGPNRSQWIRFERVRRSSKEQIKVQKLGNRSNFAWSCWHPKLSFQQARWTVHMAKIVREWVDFCQKSIRSYLIQASWTIDSGRRRWKSGRMSHRRCAGQFIKMVKFEWENFRSVWRCSGCASNASNESSVQVEGQRNWIFETSIALSTVNSDPGC